MGLLFNFNNIGINTNNLSTLQLFFFLICCILEYCIVSSQKTFICPRYTCNATMPEFDCIYQSSQSYLNVSYLKYDLKICPDNYACDNSAMTTLDFPAVCRKVDKSKLRSMSVLMPESKSRILHAGVFDKDETNRLSMLLSEEDNESAKLLNHERILAITSNIKKLPGAYCSDKTDCKSDKCTNNTCIGASPYTPCDSHDDCNFGLKCDYDKRYCNHQLYYGEEECHEDLDCINSAGCVNGTCVAYQSLINGQSSPADIFCESGHSYKGKCTQGIKIYNKKLPYTCSITEKGVETCEYFDGVNKFYLDCDCGVSASGQGYCPIGKGDTEYKTFLTVLKELMVNNNCHTMARNDEGICGRGALKETFKAAKIKSFVFHKHQLIQKNEECVKKTVLKDFYELLSSCFILLRLSLVAVVVGVLFL